VKSSRGYRERISKLRSSSSSLPPPTIPLPPPPDVFVTGKGYSRRGLRPAANVWKLATASPISADRQGGAEARKRGRGGEEGASGSRELGEKNKAGPRRRETAAETWRASSSGCPPPVSPLPPPPLVLVKMRRKKLARMLRFENVRSLRRDALF